MVFDENGELIARGKQFEEELVLADLDVEAVFHQRLHDPRQRQTQVKAVTNATTKMIAVSKRIQQHDPIKTMFTHHEPLSNETEIYTALMVETQNYVVKNGFKKVVLSLSDRIDSTLTTCIAVNALG